MSLKRRMYLVTAAVALLSVGILFQNCGSGFQAGSMNVSSSAGVPNPTPNPDPGAEVIATKITGDTHAARGECSTVRNLELIDPAGLAEASQPLAVEFPALLNGSLYADAACTQPYGETHLIPPQNFPLSIYVKSPVLKHGQLSAKVNGTEAEPLELIVYKKHFLDVTVSNIGRLMIYDEDNRTPVANYLPDLTVMNYTARLIENPADYLLSVTLGGFGFSRTRLQNSGLADDIRVSAVVAPNMAVSTTYQRCYAAENKVFCRSAGESEFMQIDLPAGELMDLNAKITSMPCAVVDGKVYCWREDRVVAEATNLGSDNIAVAANGEYLSSTSGTAAEILASGMICGLKTDRLLCLKGTETVLDLPGVVKVTDGNTRHLTIDIIENGMRKHKLFRFNTFGAPLMIDLEPEHGSFDELYFVGGLATTYKAWGRKGSSIYLVEPGKLTKLDVEILQ